MLARVAHGRAGIVGHAALLEAGIGEGAIRHRLRTQHLHAFHHGVYGVGHADLTDLGWLHAALEACGEAAAINHLSAARHYRLLPNLALRPVHVILPRERGPRRRRGIVAHRPLELDPRDVTRLGHLAITTVPRTLLDIAPAVGHAQLALAVHKARVEHRVSLPAIRTVMDRAPRHRGLRRLHAAAFGEGSAPNRRERRFQKLVRDAGLPAPRINELVRTTEGPYLVDCLWPDQRLVYEIDDLASHGTTKSLVADRRRDNALHDAGFQVRRLTDDDLWPRARLTIARLAAHLGCDKR